METIWDMGIAVVLFLQNMGHWMTAPMRFFTFLGQAEFYLLVMPILYWCVDARLGLRVALILSLKIAFHQPRPYWLTRRVHAFVSESNFGFPSGHAQNSVSLWGLLAAKMRRRWAWAVAIVLAFCIGLSRLYLGVHFPTDVLVGWLVGALVLWAFLRWEEPVAQWLSRRAVGQQVLIALVASLAVLALTLLIRLGDADPAEPGRRTDLCRRALWHRRRRNLDEPHGWILRRRPSGKAAGALSLGPRGGDLDLVRPQGGLSGRGEPSGIRPALRALCPGRVVGLGRRPRSVRPPPIGTHRPIDPKGLGDP